MMKNERLDMFLYFTFALLTLFFLQFLQYKYFVHKYFEYEFFYWNFSVFNLFLSILFIIFISYVIAIFREENISNELFIIMITISFIPMLVLFTCMGLNYYGFLISVVFSYILILTIIQTKINFKIIELVQFKYFFLFLLILCIIVSLALLKIGYKYFNLNILKVYEFREIITENTPLLISYLYNILLKGLIPVIFLFLLFELKNVFKKLMLTLFFILYYTFIFGLTSHKFFLFIIPLLVLAYVFAKYINVFSNFIILSFIGLFAIFFIVNNENFNIFVLKSLFIRRLIFVPALLNFKYYEFFSSNPFVFFSDSKFLLLHYIISYPYDLDIPHLIGREMFGDPKMGTNTSWIGSGYAHAGVLGIYIYAAIIGILFKYLDFLSKYLNPKFIIISFIPYVITLFLSSDLKTVFITHGLIFYLLILNMLAIYKEQNQGER